MQLPCNLRKVVLQRESFFPLYFPAVETILEMLSKHAKFKHWITEVYFDWDMVMLHIYKICVDVHTI